MCLGIPRVDKNISFAFPQDQDSEMLEDTNAQCKCDICCIEESPIVAVEGLLFHCCVNGESYIPTEVVEFNELIKSLQKRLAAIEARRRSFSVCMFYMFKLQ